MQGQYCGTVIPTMYNGPMPPWVLIPQHTENPWTTVIRHTNPFFKEIYHSSLCFFYTRFGTYRSAAWTASSVLAVASASILKPVSLQVSVGQCFLPSSHVPLAKAQIQDRLTEASTSLSPQALRPLLPHVNQASHSPNAATSLQSPVHLPLLVI